MLSSFTTEHNPIGSTREQDYGLEDFEMGSIQKKVG